MEKTNFLITISKPLVSQLNMRISTNALLGNHFINNELTSWDILLRYQTIDFALNNQNQNLENYKKMQKIRADKDTFEDFKELIINIKNEGFLNKYPIPISNKGTIVDGAHRLACALYFNIKEIPVNIVSNYGTIKYTKQWFLNHNFDNKLIKSLLKTKKKLFLEKGIYFPVMIWSPAKKYFKQISKEIRSKNVCVYESKIKFNNYKTFLKEIYAIDDIDKWKVELKNKIMEHYEPTIYFMLLEIANPKFRTKKSENSYLSKTCERIKKTIRTKYKKKISNYFHDIIIHMGDNYEHNEQIIKIIQKYKKFSEDEIK